MIRFQFGFEPDPDSGQGAAPEVSASWGWLEIYAGDRNLCEHVIHDQVHRRVNWYLLPVLEWLVENWDRLLHEARLPRCLVRATSARESWLRTNWAELEAAEDAEVDAWWRAHALRSAAEGGIFPDVFLRRHRDEVEVSWGNARIAGADEQLSFLCPAGRALEPADTFAAALYEALSVAVASLRQKCDAPRVQRLGEALAGLPQARPEPARYLAGWASSALAGARQRVIELTDGLVLHPAPAPLVLFGSLAPEISEPDVEAVLSLLESSQADEPKPIGLDAGGVEGKPYEQGYALAERAREMLSLPDTETPDMNLVLERLAIQQRALTLEDAGIRGIAICGPAFQPTIAVNESSPRNQSDQGRRFTLAHELCHLLFDQMAARPLAVASSDSWAPLEVEQRANGFAAMFLMPERLCRQVVEELVPHGRWTSELLRTVAKRLGTGRTATGPHLMSLHLLPPGSDYLWEPD